MLIKTKLVFLTLIFCGACATSSSETAKPNEQPISSLFPADNPGGESDKVPEAEKENPAKKDTPSKKDAAVKKAGNPGKKAGKKAK